MSVPSNGNIGSAFTLYKYFRGCVKTGIQLYWRQTISLSIKVAGRGKMI